MRRGRVALALVCVAASGATAAERLSLADGWQFQRSTDSAGSPRPATSGDWRAVGLPHDWSIELPTDAASATGGGGGYFPTGSGWYRKTFQAGRDWQRKNVSLYFEGVYRNAAVWLNGEKIGEHAYGYTPFRLEVPQALLEDGQNELLVHVDNQPQPNSRWYTGSGIYRPAWIELRPLVHVLPGSLSARTTALGDGTAVLDVSATVTNLDRLQGAGVVGLELLSPDGETVVSASVPLEAAAGKVEEAIAASLEVADPKLWSPDSPSLYELKLTLREAGDAIETVEETIGLRTLHWSAAHGLRVNGDPVELFGGNVHHDNGPLGAAAFAAAEWRKAKLLRDAGFNAVRTAHNPPSEAFLDACDRLGLLVIDEAFDGWAVRKTGHDYADIFADNWANDIRAMVLRDRNRPSVIMWSIGNEVYERGNASGIDIAHRMSSIVRQLDTTRPVTIGLNGLARDEDWSQLDAIFDAMGTAGYNYELGQHVADHERRPNRVVYASESYQNEAFANWQISTAHRYVIGDFVWSALDYLGEAGIGRVFPSSEEARAHWVGEHYPYHGALSGDIGITGNRKPISHYRNIVWDRGESLYAAVLVPTPDGAPWNLTKWSVPPALASWTWPGLEGRELTLEVYSRHPEVTVTLDGTVIGNAATSEAEKFRASFSLPYRAGRIEVRGGDEVFVLETAGTPSHLRFFDSVASPPGDSQDVNFAAVEIVDEQGRWHPAADRPVRFAIDGGEILAVGSDNLASTESYRANPRASFQGRSLVIYSVFPDAESVVLRAFAEGLAPAELRIR